MAPTPTRVLCVDDHKFLAEGLERRLELEPDFEFAGWLASAENLLEEVERLRPGIVLLDIEMPGPDSFEMLGEVKRLFPEVRTVMLSAFIRDHYIDAAVTGGAWGYLSKSDDPAAIIEALRSVAGGGFAFGPSVLERCAVDASGRPVSRRPVSRLDGLTPRELQVLRLIGKGLDRTDIARQLHRSPKTIDNHRASIMEKLGIRDRVELARFAIGEGLVEP